MSPPLLEAHGLRKAFPGVLALDDVDLTVHAGEVVALLGENGAGKSTLVKLLSGVHRPDAGQIRLAGAAFAPARPAEAIAAGVGMVHQETNLLPELSVAENIFLGRQPMRRGLVDHATLAHQARAQLDQVGLGDLDPWRRVGRLSVAARQKVEIAKALSLDATLLILDEPTAGLSVEDGEVLFGLIDELKAAGMAFIYISHRLHEVGRIADSVVVLRDGARVAAWDHGDVDTDDLVRAMVGREVTQKYPPPPGTVGQELLTVEGLTRDGVFEDVSFSLHAGEILGIAGLVGAGRTEVARAIAGADPVDAGEIRIDGQAVRLRSPEDAIAHGVVLVPEDRKEQGLVLDLPVRDNATLPSLGDVGRGGVVRPAALARLTRQLAERVDLRGQVEQSARTLSGGNQQKVVVGKWLPRQPRVVIFDEPTRGVDVGAKQAIYQIIHQLVDEGVGVVVISSELPEVLGLAHRVVVLAKGRRTGELDRDAADEESVMRLAVKG